MEVDDEEEEDLRLESLLLRWCFDADVDGDDEVLLELECGLVGVPEPPVLLLLLFDGLW